MSLLTHHGPMKTTDLLFRTQISKMAGYRHLDKLDRRGWIERNQRICRAKPAASPLQRVLIDEMESITPAQV